MNDEGTWCFKVYFRAKDPDGDNNNFNEVLGHLMELEKQGIVYEWSYEDFYEV